MTLALFIAAAVVVLAIGPRMARVADRLSTVTGMGGALFGVVFLALATDLPELALTTSASLTGTPRIAMGGLLGGAAAQLLYLAAADFALRDRRLHVGLTVDSALAQIALMAAVLTVPLLFAATDLRVGWVSTGTFVLALVYLTGLSVLRRISPAAVAGDAHKDLDGDAKDSPSVSTGALWARFAGFAAALAGAGIALEHTTESIGADLGMGETAAGALLAGVVGSLPELVTAVSAARSGAIDLAVGNLVGSSALDVSLLALADGLYADGSVFALLGPEEYTLIAVGLSMTVLFLSGVARRDVAGRASFAPESVLMIVVYLTGALVLLTG